MEVRRARVEQAQAIIDLHADTVRRINSRDYTPEQIDAGLGKRELQITETMIRNGQYYVCVNANGELLGVGRVQSNRLFGLYVSAEHQGEGVGTALLSRMEKDAVRAGIAEIEADSTATAEEFYNSRGY